MVTVSFSGATDCGVAVVARGAGVGVRAYSVVIGSDEGDKVTLGGGVSAWGVG